MKQILRKSPSVYHKVAERFNSKRNIPRSLTTSSPRRRAVSSRLESQELRIWGRFTKVVTDGSSIERAMEMQERVLT